MSEAHMVDRLVADNAMVSPYVPANHALCAALVADAMRHIPRDLDHQHCEWSECRWKSVIGPLTLPNLQSAVFMMALCVPISTVKSRMCKILSKTIVQRCMTRKFGSVCLRDFNEDKEVMMKVRQLLLCSFLGNYAHIDPTSRPLRDVRTFLYDRLFDPTDVTYVEWFYQFFKQCSHLIVFALREYLVFAIQDNPSMMTHFSSLTNFCTGTESFAAVTTGAMNEVRKFMSCNLELLHSSDKSPELFIHLNQIIAPFHERILKLSYKRMSASILPNLVAIRKVLPMKPIPNVVIHVPIKEEESEGLDDLGLDLNEEDEGDEVTEEVFDIRSYISDVQLECLRQVVNRVVPLQYGVLMKCISFFPFFGVAWSSKKYLEKVLQDIHEGNVSYKEEVYYLRKLYQRDPHAYTLLQVTAELLKEALSIRVAATLPAHYLNNQLDAVKSKFGLEETKFVVSTNMYFCFCTICDTVYSLVSEFQSVYKQQYLFGLRSAVVGT